MKTLSHRSLLIAATLLALMTATRSNLFNHFGTANFLPDASLAVFIIAGFFMASPLFFAVLLMLAIGIDYLAITQFGISDYCITAAYWALIPTYAVLWLAGKAYARVHQDSLQSLGKFAVVALSAVSMAFLISNGAFYALSGKFAEMSLAEYAARVTQYYVPYLLSAVVYLIPAILVYAVSQQRIKTQA